MRYNSRVPGRLHMTELFRMPHRVPAARPAARLAARLAARG
jgi:hypothetical protein